MGILSQKSEKIITKDELLMGNWTPVRNEVWLSSVLSQGAKLCYIAICSHIWKKNEEEAWPGQKRLAQMLGTTDRNIRNYLRELETVGIIMTERQGLTKTNKYFICKPDAQALKPITITERKTPSSQERKQNSAQERNELSDKEQAINKQTTNEKTKDPFVAEKSSDDNKKINFASYREQLQNNKNALIAFEYIADKSNFSGIRGNVLKQFCEWSSKIVEEAFIETHKRNKDSFAYFAKVFKTKYDNSLRKIQVPEDISWINKYSKVYADAKIESKTLLEWQDDEVRKALKGDAARLSITVEEVVEKITEVLGGNL